MNRLGWSLVTLALVVVACSEDPYPAVDEEAALDDSPTTPGAQYGGPTTGGVIPRPAPPDEGDAMPSSDFDVDRRCCNVMLWLDDATGDETVARVKGDYTPLDGEGLALTHANGKWSAVACIPLGTYVRYGFYFGTKLVDPNDDAGGTVEDLRSDPTVATTLDGEGRTLNTFGPVADCSEVDASTGQSP